jgi:phosphomannomutase
MIEENRSSTIRAIRESHADFGIAWDGDFDRCFLFDEQGGFIEGYYIVGLLASVLLRGQPGAKVVHDPRLTWNTIEVVQANGGQTVLSKSGHAFIKQRMREVDGVYGGEMSAHHYFRRFAYCDSGMIPWLLIAQILSETGQPLSQLVGKRIGLFPVSGELNYRVPDSKATLAAVEARYASQASVLDRTDGVSFEFPDWRFNLRTSNTEPLIRLNVEARGSVKLMRAKTEELLSLLKAQGAIAADH